MQRPKRENIIKTHKKEVKERKTERRRRTLGYLRSASLKSLARPWIYHSLSWALKSNY